MKQNYLDSIRLVLKGVPDDFKETDARFLKVLSNASLEYGYPAIDGKLSLVYRIPLGHPHEFARETARWRKLGSDFVNDINGLSICIDCCNEDLMWERLEIDSGSSETLLGYPVPLYPRAFSLYADVDICIEQDRQMHDVFAALRELSDEVSLLDDYADVFPEYADIGTSESLTDCDDWDADEWERDEERALDEQDYGGWWLTWKNGDDSNIEKLQSGKLLISIIGKLCDAGHADFVLPSEHRWLLEWIPQFVSLVDYHELWHQGDDIKSIRLAVAWCEEMEMQSTL
jgi:hypothetical protein